METIVTIRKIGIWIQLVVAVHCAGCLDLNLLDEMNPMDAGEAQASDNKDVDNSDDGNSDDGNSDDGDDNGGNDNGGNDNDGKADEGDEEVDTDGSPQGEDSDSMPFEDTADESPPSVVPVTCGAKERSAQDICISEGAISALLRFGTDEPSTVSLEASDDAAVVIKVLSDPWGTVHRAAVTNLSGDADTSLTVRSADINDNETTVSVSVRGAGGAPAVVTEVLSDPFGEEPSQEFVEVANIGSESLDLSCWMVDDNNDQNGDLLPDGTILEAGQVAILVSPNFVANASGEDPAPADGTLIVYLESSIGSNGLKNSEAETVELYDAEGNLVSAYDGSVGAPAEGVSASRVFAELPDGAPEAFAVDSSGASSPGVISRLE